MQYFNKQWLSISGAGVFCCIESKSRPCSNWMRFLLAHGVRFHLRPEDSSCFIMIQIIPFRLIFIYMYHDDLHHCGGGGISYSDSCVAIQHD